VLESLLLGDDGLGLCDAVGELEGREVAVVAGPADEGAGKASCCGPAGEPVVDVGLNAGRGGVASFPEVVEECEGDRCRLFRGEEGALLQPAAGGEMVHAVEVDPACELFNQSPVVRVSISEFAGQPVLESFDIEVDGVEERGTTRAPWCLFRSVRTCPGPVPRAGAPQVIRLDERWWRGTMALLPHSESTPARMAKPDRQQIRRPGRDVMIGSGLRAEPAVESVCKAPDCCALCLAGDGASLEGCRSRAFREEPPD